MSAEHPAGPADGGKVRTRRTGASLALVTTVLAAACTAPAEDPVAAPARDCPALVAPADGVLMGVNIDWSRQTLAEYSALRGRRPAVAVSFAGFPLSAQESRDVDAAVDQVRDGGGSLLLTLEPTGGLATVTDEAAAELVTRLDGYNRSGVPVVVRFAHEMNGSWYAWGQQPAAYIAAFRRVAAAVHAGAPGSLMMWAPNYGGGYPFAGGRFAAAPGTGDAVVLDTDGDGQVTVADDPYAPYWPGDDAVDWVGMSLYHWGDAWPWGENEVPEPGKFVAQLTGEYVGLGGGDPRPPGLPRGDGGQHRQPGARPPTPPLPPPRARRGRRRPPQEGPGGA